MSIFKAEQVSVNLDPKFSVLDLNLTVEEKEKILLFGKSGSGKTTILKMFLGFVIPSQGKLFFRDEEINCRNIWDLRSQVSYVSQNNNIGDIPVKEVIDRIMSFKVNRNIQYKHKLNQYLDLFEKPLEILDKEFSDLSGGEQQIINIIISLLLERKIFLLDEITSSLDVKLKNKVQRYFSQQEQCTEIIVSHDQSWMEFNNIKTITVDSIWAQKIYH
ncbi:MAG: ABC transporter ATP-binding protein [bacterium]